ncbi:MAG: hypothetical protein HY901_19745 [Deltaproteobacteria bacterium]|nr:hypothetical protein [Deltaproteobacteria bacterium]
MRIENGPTSFQQLQAKGSTASTKKASSASSSTKGIQFRDGFDSSMTQSASSASSSARQTGIGGLVKMGLAAIAGFALAKIADKIFSKSQASDSLQGTSKGTTPFPDASGVLCEAVTSEGSGKYHGTAGVLFPTSWLGKIDSVKLGDEVGQMGTPHNGKEICRFLKPGNGYTWPQTLTISSGGKTYSMQVTEQMMLGTSSGSSGPTGSSGSSGTSFEGTTKKLDGYGGFLWKPTSENDGKLVVLLPAAYAGQAKSVEVQDAQGNTLGTGKYSSNANGGRDHFRFSKPGSSYGNNVYVVATLSSGEKIRYPISNGGERTD